MRKTYSSQSFLPKKSPKRDKSRFIDKNPFAEEERFE